MKVKVTNIQRFCLNDGPGIRTTVFFKGCNLRCPWCSNPENISFEIEEYQYEDTNGIYGYEIDLKDLEEEILKDKLFYKTGGGVTFSGGEALLQFDKIEILLKKLKEQNINMCIETALTVPEYLVDIAIKYIDEFIVDIKILDEDSIYKIGGDIELFKLNIKKVFNNKKNVVFRIPLVKDYTTPQKNLDLILKFLSEYRPERVEIFNIHNLSEKKYQSLNKKNINFKKLSDEEINSIKDDIEALGIPVQVNRI